MFLINLYNFDNFIKYIYIYKNLLKWIKKKKKMKINYKILIKIRKN